MKTRTFNVDGLFKLGLFEIPSYQRSYAWEQPQLQELVEDLYYLPENTSHFFGNVIVDKQGREAGRELDVFDVVDGQQRLTSTLIFFKVAASFEPAVEQSLAEDNLIFPIHNRPRLLPQDQDKEYFRDALFGGSRLEPKTPSQVRLQNAYKFFQDAFHELSEQVTVPELTETLRYNCKVNVVEIDGESEAASIFESINNRGKPLSALEKTKSFLIYMDDRTSNRGRLADTIKQRFGSIYRELFVFSTGHKRADDFDEASLQRFHWAMFDGYDSDEYFSPLKTLKLRLQENFRDGQHEAVQDTIESYTSDLRQGATAFAALLEPSDRPEVIREPLKRLLELGRMANLFPVLMASHLQYGDRQPEAMRQILEAAETLAFRVYAIDGRRSDTGRSILVRLAHDIHSESLDVDEIVGRLDKITARYTSDKRFRRKLEEPEFFKSNSSRDISYLLYFYAQQLEEDAGEEVLKDLAHILSEEFHVEHILASRLPPDEIPANLEHDFDDYVHRLGNLTIASRYWNSSYGNLPFEAKKRAKGDRQKAYSNSAIRVQRVLADYETFGREQIESRTERLVEFALQRWSINPPAVETDAQKQTDEFIGELPESFFDRLTTKQEAFFQILFREDYWMSISQIMEQMNENLETTSRGTNPLAGIQAGITRKYGRSFLRSIVPGERRDGELYFRLELNDLQQERFEAESGGDD